MKSKFSSALVDHLVGADEQNKKKVKEARDKIPKRTEDGLYVNGKFCGIVKEIEVKAINPKWGSTMKDLAQSNPELDLTLSFRETDTAKVESLLLSKDIGVAHRFEIYTNPDALFLNGIVTKFRAIPQRKDFAKNKGFVLYDVEIKGCTPISTNAEKTQVTKRQKTLFIDDLEL